jgi:hypothetical protein
MQSPGRSALAAAVYVAILCTGGAASAQLTEKQAQRQLAAASRDGLATYKQQLKTSRSEAEANIDAFELVLAGSPSQLSVLPFFDDLAALQRELTQQASTAIFAGYIGAAQGLIDLRGAGPSLAGIFPAGFYPGDGGTLDRHLEAVRVQSDRFYAQLGKRLARTEKLAERAGIGLTVRLRQSHSFSGATFSDVISLISTGVRGLTLDTLVAASFLANAGDGVLAIGGQADDAYGAVSVRIRGNDGTDMTDSISPDATTERFACNTFSDFAAAGLPEGAFFVTAQQLAGPLQENVIGVR